MSRVRLFLASSLCGQVALALFATAPSQTVDAELPEFCARLDELGTRTELPRLAESLVQEFQPAQAASARDWPRQHGWVACGLRARAPAKQPAQLALWDVRSRAPLLTQQLPAETTTSYVFLLRVPELDRCALLRQDGARWVFETGREIPEAARAGGFGALALPLLEYGGWIESGVHSVLVEERARVRPRIENLWLWSGNGKGTLELAQSKDAKERGVSSGSSVAGDAPEFDPWFLQNPLRDWPWPVWSLRVEVQPKRP